MSELGRSVGEGRKGGVWIRPTEQGLPPTMLNPREPPSRTRTTVTLLASPSYGQTEERHAGQRDWEDWEKRNTAARADGQGLLHGCSST